MPSFFAIAHLSALLSRPKDCTPICLIKTPPLPLSQLKNPSL